MRRPEITDDEDEVGRYLTTFNPGSKRLRIEEEYEMASQSHGRYITRGSGRRPDIEGLVKQPWEFDFSCIKSRRQKPSNGK